jgi:hypothetical protein
LQNTEKAAEEDFLLDDAEFYKPMDVSKVSKAVPNFDFEETKNSSFAGVSETPISSRILN